MDYLSLITQPISSEIDDFKRLFDKSLEHENGLLQQALDHIRQRAGKRMRPMLILLIAKNFGKISDVTQHAAVGLELLHTASLVHDDVVDESSERRGQASVNKLFDNKVSVLVGDYILSTALLNVSYTHSEVIVRYLANLGRTLSDGEILQLTNISNEKISEPVYFDIINNKTAALFEACAAIGAASAGASEEDIEAARRFGQQLGIIFQIKDDIFDYSDSEDKIGKPTGNDLTEGKVTLPLIYALNHTKDAEMMALVRKVKEHTVSHEEIRRLVDFAVSNDGIEYAERRMMEIHESAEAFIDTKVSDAAIKTALKAYLDFVIKRSM